MEVTLAYLGRSGYLKGSGHAANGGVLLAPNLGREAVSFGGTLREPLRFREAISALHDVVIGDLRFQPRDKSAYQAYKQQQNAAEAALRKATFEEAKAKALEAAGADPELEGTYNRARAKYWRTRSKYSNYLLKHDRELWRKLMPCDPVVTVAEDVVFFECFSADESSYGCLTVDRNAFGDLSEAQLGTTNVDYSWDLYDAFQGLRTYRGTRLEVDPEGFQVNTASRPDYREEKIDLPQGWLRGFMEVQAAMALPMRRVSLDRESVYSLLAFLRRNRAKQSPRAIRFELVSGHAPALVLEPTGTRIVSHGTTYDGPDLGVTRIWGRRRLLVLARLLPLVDRVDVYLLGTGLPSFWVARMGNLRFTLGLSGWTANDWTRSSALDLLLPPTEPDAYLVERIAKHMASARQATFAELESAMVSDPSKVAAALNHLAHSGQMIHDLDAGMYRWRQIMPMALGEAQMGPENAELRASRDLVSHVRLGDVRTEDDGRVFISGTVREAEVELLLDADGRIRRGACKCSLFFRNKLRMGPCRHLLALRAKHQGGADSKGSTRAWYDALLSWKS